MTRQEELSIPDLVFQKDGDLPGFFERSTATFRKTPDVFIVGAQKAGTSSLYRFLVENGVVARSKQKEIYFFNNSENYAKGMSWYKAHFPLFSGISNCDATANTFESPESPARVKECFPEAKIIVLLRNPVDRAFSHYRMAASRSIEPLSFDRALELEDARMAFGEETGKGHNYVYQRMGYRSKGRYADLLKRWMHAFPPEQLLVIQSEQLFASPESKGKEVLRFLGASEEIKIPLNQENKGAESEMDENVRAALQHYYAPLNQELFELLGKSFDWK